MTNTDTSTLSAHSSPTKSKSKRKHSRRSRSRSAVSSTQSSPSKAPRQLSVGDGEADCKDSDDNASTASPRKRPRSSRSTSPTALTPTPQSEPPASGADLQLSSKPKLSRSDRLVSKINIAKSLIRPALPPTNWDRLGYSTNSLWHKIIDHVPRINYHTVSVSEFVERFERPDLPVVISGVCDDWPAKTNWEPQTFYNKYKDQKFKVGTDDDDNSVYLKYKHFSKYCVDPELAGKEDSPLYIFDPNFPTRKSGKNKSDRPLRALLNDYNVPAYFADDLFQYISTYRRPPYRWIVIGPERSGTGIHLDPLGTSAWNSLVFGYKRWCLFPPTTPKHLVNPPRRAVFYDQKDMRYGIKRVCNTVHDLEAATWFNEVYPNLAPYREQLGMLEIVQKPGETVFVPGGWWHVVINLSFTVAVTQNFCSVANFERVYLQARRSRPKMTAKWRQRMEQEARANGIDVDQLKCDDNTNAVALPSVHESAHNPREPGKWTYLVRTMHCLETVPAVPGSSTSSGSSSTTDSSIDSEDEL
ncbi:hypothetical protein BCR44DRAFT_40971 [Catenaria anguillulae PL171]|uniref:JmjC domain-containing protein n=1 Tax=Catenaria anguillulae PL171 TaxID=765915 RepID=A0A1Y2HPK9_9FUNG|nr:hypothetical protein BCR44DRAFT_40971 [Catenaria anguillulae PL171]